MVDRSFRHLWQALLPGGHFGTFMADLWKSRAKYWARVRDLPKPLCHLVVRKEVQRERGRHSVPRVQYCSDQWPGPARAALLPINHRQRTANRETHYTRNFKHYELLWHHPARGRRAPSSFLFAINQEWRFLHSYPAIVTTFFLLSSNKILDVYIVPIYLSK